MPINEIGILFIDGRVEIRSVRFFAPQNYPGRESSYPREGAPYPLPGMTPPWAPGQGHASGHDHGHAQGAPGWTPGPVFPGQSVGEYVPQYGGVPSAPIYPPHQHYPRYN